MYQAEALWIQFYPSAHAVHVIPWPFAIQVATGGVNAISGSLWKPDQRLVHQPQDYVVVPGQPWLDGFCVGNGFIRQFVAMPFGEGFTAEEQLMGEAKKGGLQIRAVPMKRDAYESLIEQEKGRFGAAYTLLGGDIPAPVPCICPSFGFAPGGRMVQDLYKSDFEPDVWDEENAVQTFIHVLNSLQWQQVTGRAMPHPPASASKYTSAGLPWFDYYDDSRCSLEGSERLAGLESVAARKNRLGDALPDNDSVVPSSVIQLKKR
ncbi:MAG: hypothetical protein Q4D91_09945 [Lautropia sp.]|nr:hypothetical protein [Lautropia sp.]